MWTLVAFESTQDLQRLQPPKCTPLCLGPRAYNAVWLCPGLDCEWGFTVRASSFCALDVRRILRECTKHVARKWPVPLQYALVAPALKRRTHFASGRC